MNDLTMFANEEPKEHSLFKIERVPKEPMQFFYDLLGIDACWDYIEQIKVNKVPYSNIVHIFGQDFTAFLFAAWYKDADYIIKINGKSFIHPRVIPVLADMITQGTVEEIRKKIFVKPKIKTYIAIDSNSGFIKIGKSKDPGFRIKEQMCSNPSIRLTHICEENCESKVHRKLDVYNVRGEWYDIPEYVKEKMIKDFNFKKVKNGID